MTRAALASGCIGLCILSHPALAQGTTAFDSGVTDRNAWEDWFSASGGDFHAGAEFWATHRSDPNPGSCKSNSPAGNEQWVAGCEEARSRIAPFDRMRKSDPTYRQGWNSVPDRPAAGPRANQATIFATGTLPLGSAPNSPVLPLVHANPPEQPAQNALVPIPRQEEPSAISIPLVLTVVLVFVVGLILWRFFARRALTEELFRELALEIKRHSSALGVARLQLMKKDRYGTENRDAWDKEIIHFINTRLRPIAEQFGRPSERLAAMSSRLFIEIELTAQYYEARGIDSIPSYVSSPLVFDPRMDPIDYELYCAAQLRAAGWHTRQTATSGDQGADVIAHKNGIALILQCKLYSNPVGNDAVQQAFAAKQHERAQLAAVVTNTTFTRSAQQLAATTGVRLLHHSELRDLHVDAIDRAARI